MSFDHLSEFLNVLADRGDLARVRVPVDSVLELAAITQRVASNGKASADPNLVYGGARGCLGQSRLQTGKGICPACAVVQTRCGLFYIHKTCCKLIMNHLR